MEIREGSCARLSSPLINLGVSPRPVSVEKARGATCSEPLPIIVLHRDGHGITSHRSIASFLCRNRRDGTCPLPFHGRRRYRSISASALPRCTLPGRFPTCPLTCPGSLLRHFMAVAPEDSGQVHKGRPPRPSQARLDNRHTLENHLVRLRPAAGRSS